MILMNERVVRIYTVVWRYSGVTKGNPVTELRLSPWEETEDFIGNDDGGVDYILPEGFVHFADPVSKKVTIRTKIANKECYLLPYGYSKKPALVDPTKSNGILIWLKRLRQSKPQQFK